MKVGLMLVFDALPQLQPECPDVYTVGKVPRMVTQLQRCTAAQPELPLCSVPNGATAPGYGAAAPCYGARPKKEMYGRSDGGFAAERRRGARRGGAGFVCAPHPAGPLAGGAPPGMGTVRAANKSGTRERGRKTELFCQITERITERCCPLPARSNSSAAAAP